MFMFIAILPITCKFQDKMFLNFYCIGRIIIVQRLSHFIFTTLNVSPFSYLAGCDESIILLLDHIKHVDKVDVKAQTPLFVAMVNKHWSSGR